MKGLQGERLRQAFRYFDKKETGVRIETSVPSRNLADCGSPVHRSTSPQTSSRRSFLKSRHINSQTPSSTACRRSARSRLAAKSRTPKSSHSTTCVRRILPQGTEKLSRIPQVLREMDAVERVIVEAVNHSKDEKIDKTDFMNTAARTTRYGIFSPMETNIIFVRDPPL